MAHDIDPQVLNRLRKNAPSRDKIDQLRRVALSFDGTDDADLLNQFADFLDDARTALRGGRRDISGGRKWNL